MRVVQNFQHVCPNEGSLKVGTGLGACCKFGADGGSCSLCDVGFNGIGMEVGWNII